jgi:hypothetical protein
VKNEWWLLQMRVAVWIVMLSNKKSVFCPKTIRLTRVKLASIRWVHQAYKHSSITLLGIMKISNLIYSHKSDWATHHTKSYCGLVKVKESRIFTKQHKVFQKEMSPLEDVIYPQGSSAIPSQWTDTPLL